MTAGPAAVFLDRDGTINLKAPEGAYVTDPAQLRLLPGAGVAVARLNRAGIPVALVTNQRGIARGRMTLEDLGRVHERLAVLLDADGAHLDAVLACPHERDECECRKPAPGLVLQAAAALGIEDLGATVTIGDSESDVAAGRAAGTRTVLLTGTAPVAADTAADARAPDLESAVTRLLAP